MSVEYEPVARHLIESRKKHTVTALLAGTVTTLVSAAISGMVRHVVGVSLDNRSGQGQVHLFVADASGATGAIERVELAPFFTSGIDFKKFAEWHPPKRKQPYYDLSAGEKLMGLIDSGYAFAKVQLWDEEYGA
jgi:hypothetical protein